MHEYCGIWMKMAWLQWISLSTSECWPAMKQPFYFHDSLKSLMNKCIWITLCKMHVYSLYIIYAIPGKVGLHAVISAGQDCLVPVKEWIVVSDTLVNCHCFYLMTSCLKCWLIWNKIRLFWVSSLFFFLFVCFDWQWKVNRIVFILIL